MASVRPSPRRLKTVTVTKIANPGMIANHHALKYPLAADSMLPQVTSSGRIPIPRNDKLDSNRMALATPKAIATNTYESELGNACLNIVLNSL